MKHAAHLHLNEIVLPPAKEWAPSSSGWVFLRLKEGKTYWLGEAAALDLEPGSLLVLPPARGGVLRASQMGRACLHCFRFCPELAAGILILPERQYLDRIAVKPGLSARRLPAVHPAAQLLSRLCASDPVEEGLRFRARLLEVVAMAFDWEFRPRPRGAGRVLHPSRRIVEVIRQLTEMELVDRSADSLAAQCGCSKQHFARLFQLYFGISFRALQTELRMLKARRLLSESDLTIQEVAHKTGTWQWHYFNTLFKREFGVTPTEFRRQKQRALELSGSGGPPG